MSGLNRVKHVGLVFCRLYWVIQGRVEEQRIHSAEIEDTVRLPENIQEKERQSPDKEQLDQKSIR